MRIYTSPWLYAKGREIDILATLEENYEKCPPPWPIPGYAPDIRITHPPNTGSLYWNYKHFNLILLLALCDAEYLFLYVDIGAYGKSSNSTIWKNCNLHKLLDKNELDIPNPQPIHNDGTPLPYVFIGDEAFGLRGSSRQKWSKLSNFCFLLKKCLQVWGHYVPNF